MLKESVRVRAAFAVLRITPASIMRQAVSVHKLEKSPTPAYRRSWGRTLAGLFLALASLPVFASSSYYVSPTGNDNNSGTQSSPLRTIQVGLNRAITGDSIILENGTYTGPGNVDLNVATAVTIEGEDGASAAVVDCQGSGSHNHNFLTYTSVGTISAPAQVIGVTVEDGYETSNAGAININGSILNISHCVFSENQGVSGGVAYEDSNSTVAVSNCSFAQNISSGQAGTYYNSGTLSFVNCTESGGSAGSESAIYNDGSASIQNCSFSGNTCTYDGAILNDGSASMEVTGCSFSNNLSSGDVGALKNNGGHLSVGSCIFSGNQSLSSAEFPAGGAFECSFGNSTVADCLFSNNSGGAGGAAWVAGPCTFEGCTFTGNSATNGGGGAIYVTDATATLTDDILWGDSAPNDSGTAEIGLAAGSFPGMAYVSYSDVEAGYSGTGNINTAPGFISGYKVASNSPCLNAGIEVLGMTYDLAGRYRHNPPTMGAYEAGSQWQMFASVASPNGNTVTLLESLSGELWMLTITPSGTHSSEYYGPYPSANPLGVAVGPDNHIYLTWLLTEEAGEIEIWNITPTTYTYIGKYYAPGSAWKWTSTSVDSSSNVHISFQDAQGEIWLWSATPSGTITRNAYGPYN